MEYFTEINEPIWKIYFFEHPQVSNNYKKNPNMFESQCCSPSETKPFNEVIVSPNINLRGRVPAKVSDFVI